MAGGPSQLETFDPKPKLGELDGQPMPESLTQGQQLAQLQGQKLVCFAPQHPFQKFGKNGIEKVIELDLNADEKALLETSRGHVKEVMNVLDKLGK
jgi:malate/lactate dehydrogenase